MFEIYMHTCKITGKSYIGITKNGAENRWKSHISDAKKGIYYDFQEAIRQYGSENFEMEILDTCKTQAEAIDLEKFYIKQYNTYKNGYNMNEGGCTAKTGDEHWSRKNPEKVKRGENHWVFGKEGTMKGKHLTEEQKQKVSMASIGFVVCKSLSKPELGKFKVSKEEFDSNPDLVGSTYGENNDTEESRYKKGAKFRGKKLPRCCCILCHKEVCVRDLKKHQKSKQCSIAKL